MSTAVAVPGQPVDMEQHAVTLATELAQLAAVLRVVDAGSAEKAAALLREIVGRRKAAAEWFQPMKESTHRAWKSVCEREREVLAKFAGPESVTRGKLTAYQAEAERVRRAAVAAAAQAAREEAERQRIANAEAAMDEGDLDEAEAILDAPPPLVVVPTVQAEPAPELDGVSFSTVWQFEVVDEAALPRQYTTPDVKKIRRVVTALGEGTQIPGVRVWSEKVSRVRV